MKTKKKHPPSPKLLAHLKRLNLARRKKGRKPAAAKKPTKPAKAAAKPRRAKSVVPAIPPIVLPKGDAAGQTTMPVVEAAVTASTAPVVPATAPGEELL